MASRFRFVPGIVPILSGSQIKRFTALCGARIPAPLAARLDRVGRQRCGRRRIWNRIRHQAMRGTASTTGAPGIHFYTLNKAHSTVRVLRNLSLAREPREALLLLEARSITPAIRMLDENRACLRPRAICQWNCPRSAPPSSSRPTLQAWPMSGLPFSQALDKPIAAPALKEWIKARRSHLHCLH